MRIPIAGTAGLIAALLVTVTTPAVASEPVEPLLDVLGAVTDASVDPAADVLGDVADVPTDTAGTDAIAATVRGVDITVPTEATDPLTLATDAASIELTLPFSDVAASAEVLREGVVSYDNGNGSTSVPVVKDDGSVQVATIITDASAPTRYAYDIGLAPGSSLVLEADGMVSVVGPNGEPVGGFAPAWAVDANGATVPTHYEVDGTTLVQIVEHATADVAYPVTADPYLGMALIKSGRWVSTSSGRSLQITPTTWGRANGNNPTAVSALLNEYCNKFASGCTTQMFWQLGCHAQFAPFKSTWNLDTWRYRSSYVSYIVNKCN